ncbi:MAG: hypothetical protein KAS32_25385 [Candidatus Peribacteraceae bacterium]|nr:hypothetical protein [Candidatus Peribacteraceae bacterium]
MSYESYERALCANGHLHEWGCYDSMYLQAGKEYTWHCPDCGCLAVWWESVDQTNDEGIKTELVEVEPAKKETCSKCMHVKVVDKEKYYIPSNTGLRINKEVSLNALLRECVER